MNRRTVIAWWPLIFLVALAILVFFYTNVVLVHTGPPPH